MPSRPFYTAGKTRCPARGNNGINPNETLKAITGEEAHAKTQRRKGGKGQKAPSSLRLGAFARDLGSDLHDLVARGLMDHDKKEVRFDLHPIVRRYAYDRLAAPVWAAAHTTLRDYFAAVPAPDKVTRLEDLAPVIELYHHTVRAGQLDEARTLYRDRLDPLDCQLGACQLIIDLLRPLFPDGEDRPPRLKDESDQAWTLAALANSHSLSGQPRRAVPLFEQTIAMCEKQGDTKNLAIDLGNVADDQSKIGALRAAEANLRRSIALAQEIEDEMREGDGRRDLGQLLTYRGAWADAEAEFWAALEHDKKQKHVQAQGTLWAYRALHRLLMLRQAACEGNLRFEIPDLKSALAAARRALELADEAGRPADEALLIADRSGCVLQAADAHLELAKLALARGDQTAAREHAEQAYRLAACDAPFDSTVQRRFGERQKESGTSQMPSFRIMATGRKRCNSSSSSPANPSLAYNARA